MALITSLKRGERIVIDGVEIIVRRSVTLEILTDCWVELPDQGKVLSRPDRAENEEATVQ